MDKIETIEKFYKRKFDWMPENIKNEIGHFNVLKLLTHLASPKSPISIIFSRSIP